jgi:hypothetical protein
MKVPVILQGPADGTEASSAATSRHHMAQVVVTDH